MTIAAGVSEIFLVERIDNLARLDGRLAIGDDRHIEAHTLHTAPGTVQHVSSCLSVAPLHMLTALTLLLPSSVEHSIELLDMWHGMSYCSLQPHFEGHDILYISLRPPAALHKACCIQAACRAEQHADL